MIVVVEYDPAWPQRFEQLRREYARCEAAGRASINANQVPSHDEFPR